MKRFLMMITAALVLPAVIFARGAIVPYVEGWVSEPTDYELDRMTHLMIFQIFPGWDGSLTNGAVNSLPNWVRSGISRAKAKGIKVSIAIGGASADYTPRFPSATNSTNMNNFVNNIVTLVSNYGLDGVDLDWEFPRSDQEWRQYADLIVNLKNRMPDKRISVAIGGDSPSSQYGNHFMRANSGAREYVRQRIFYADAIHLMTYDMQGVTGWTTHHSDLDGTMNCLEAWDQWGRGVGHGANGQGVAARYNKEKLFVGVAPYATQGTRGDTQWEAEEKVKRTYDAGGGGVIMWALGESRKSGYTGFVTAMWNANQAKGGLVENGTVSNHRITMTHNGNGRVTSGGNDVASGGFVEVANGQNRGFTFTPNTGYSVTNVRANNTDYADSTRAFTFSNVTSAQTIDITFAKRHNFPGSFNATEYSKKHQDIRVQTDAGNYVGYLNNGRALEYLININGGAGKYKLGAEVATNAGANGTPSVTVNVAGTNAGTITAQSGGWTSFTEREIEFDVSATGNQLLRLTANGELNIRNITVTKVTAGKLLVTATDNGFGTVGGAGEVNSGESKTLTFTPNAGYALSDLKINGVSITPTPTTSYTIQNITTDQQVEAAFAKRFTVPVSFNATEYSKKSAEIVIENAEAPLAERSLGYLENNSEFEFMLSVTTAGVYVVGVETAVGLQGNRTLTLSNGSGNLGTISTPGGTDWTAYRSRGVTVNLSAGAQILKFTADGAVNVRNITITKEGETPCDTCGDPIIITDADLADGKFVWEPGKDNYGSNAVITSSDSGNISFNMNLEPENDPDPETEGEEGEEWTWTNVASYPGGDWSGVTEIRIIYTSDKPFILTLQDNGPMGWALAGRGFCVILPAGTKDTAINISDFKQVAANWTDSVNISAEQLVYMNGVSLSPTKAEPAVSGTIRSLEIKGLLIEPEEEPTDPTTPIITPAKSDGRYGIRFAQNIVSVQAEIFVNAECEMRNAELKIYDMTGNVVFVGATALGRPFVWDLRNTVGRIVANGSYLVVVEAKDIRGQRYHYSAKLGVKR